MSDLVSLILDNKAYLSLVLIYLILPKYKNLTYITLNIILILSLLIFTNLFLIIFLRYFL